MSAKVNFNNANNDFHADVRQRVDAYFASTGLSRGCDARMIAKTLFWVGATTGFYALVMSSVLPAWFALLACMALGFCLACIGFNIGHDAIHGAYSENPRVNRLLSWSFDLMGASSYTWSISHNFVHHTYTNIPNVDNDLEPGPWIRLYPRPGVEGYVKSFHRYQHIYAWFLYCFTSLVWVFTKDFVQIRRVDPRTGRAAPKLEFVGVAVSKLAHFGLLFIAPLLVTGYAWWQVAIGYVVMNFVGGFTLAIVFQMAHVVDGPEFPEAAADMGSWAVHQMKTTANFSRGYWLATWICGGLDFQVEHHLFPKICHTHYPKLAPIVKQCAADHGVPYLENPTFWAAVKSHARALKKAGRPAPAVASMVVDERLASAAE